jgi:hypothetical protein
VLLKGGGEWSCRSVLLVVFVCYLGCKLRVTILNVAAIAEKSA